MRQGWNLLTIKLLFLAFLLTLAGIGGAYAQATPPGNVGFPQFSSVTGGPDQINLGNFDIHWSFPIFSKKERGGTYNVTLAYDSASVFHTISIGPIPPGSAVVGLTNPNFPGKALAVSPGAGFTLTNGINLGYLGARVRSVIISDQSSGRSGPTGGCNGQGCSDPAPITVCDSDGCTTTTCDYTGNCTQQTTTTNGDGSVTQDTTNSDGSYTVVTCSSGGSSACSGVSCDASGSCSQTSQSCDTDGNCSQTTCDDSGNCETASCDDTDCMGVDDGGGSSPTGGIGQGQQHGKIQTFGTPGIVGGGKPAGSGGVTELFFDMFSYVDPTGFKHNFNGLQIAVCPSNASNCKSNMGPATDPYGYILTLVNPNQGMIQTPSGETVYLAINGGATEAVDTNGNVFNTQAVITPGQSTMPLFGGDTLGMAPVTVNFATWQSSGLLNTNLGLLSGAGPAGPITLTYTDANGQSQSVVINTPTFQVQTDLGCGGGPMVLKQTVPLITSIVYPDGSSYSFAYEPTPGVSGAVTGRLQSVTMPTGGTITYAYTGPYLGAMCSLQDSAATSPGTFTATLATQGITRTTSDGAQTTYTRSALTPITFGTNQLPGYPSEIQTVVDTPLSRVTVNFMAEWLGKAPLAAQMGFTLDPAEYLETSRIISDKTLPGGGSAGTTVETHFTCYNGASVPCDGQPISLLPVQQTTAVIQYATGERAQTVTHHNNFGGVTESDQYDYGQNAVGPLLRKTVTSYATLGNNILSRPASVTVYDGAGNQIGKTLSAYDETPVAPTSNVPSHQAVTGARGNLTTTQLWTGGNNYVTAHSSYDDTGNVISTTDGRGEVTTFSYADNFRDGVNRNSDTFISKVTSPQTTDNPSHTVVAHTAGSVYDPSTGLTTRKIDANGNATDLCYDGMLRLVRTLGPADSSGHRPVTDVTYPNVHTVTTTKTVTASSGDPTGCPSGGTAQ